MRNRASGSGERSGGEAGAVDRRERSDRRPSVAATRSAIWVSALLGLVTPAAAQTCPSATESWGDPWPETAGIDAVDAEKIRCAVVRAVRSDRVNRLPTDLRDRVRNREVGPTWSDAGRPRIGSFWFELEGDQVVLRSTLAMTSRVRIGLVIRLRKRGRRWVVTAFNHSTAHARR